MRRGLTLVPRLFSHWWETLEHPHRLLNQRFGKELQPEEFFNKFFQSQLKPYYRSESPFPFPFPFPVSSSSDGPSSIEWEQDKSGWSVIKNDKDKFRVILDVQQFKPEDINVKIIDNYIIVEGKHEEKEDEHGIVSRHFIRKYLIPDQCDADKASSSMSEDGILMLMVPLKPEVSNKREKIIKIERVEKQKSEDEPQKAKQSQ